MLLMGEFIMPQAEDIAVERLFSIVAQSEIINVIAGITKS